MLERLVLGVGPGADEIGARAFGLLAQGGHSTVFAGPLRLAACFETRALVTVADTLAGLWQAASLLDRRSHQFTGWKMFAYSSRLPSPRPGWAPSARFPILTVRCEEPADRFTALETTARLLCHLGSPSDLIEERIRLAVDP